MKKILLIILILTVNILSTSCSKNNDESNPYQGNWSGNLNGDIVGTWSGNVSSSGNFNGNVIPNSTTPDHNFVLSGQVNESGNLVATMKNTTYNINIDFIGTFQNNLCNGTWIFNGAGMQGTWSGTKK
jgi:hypothetical protein